MMLLCKSIIIFPQQSLEKCSSIQWSVKQQLKLVIMKIVEMWEHVIMGQNLMHTASLKYI